VRWLRFLIGLLIALTIHSIFDSFFPNALAFFNPYIILVVYYSMGGNLFGAIIAGVIAGFVQDAYSQAIFGLHAFSLTVCAYLVAYVNSRLVLRGALAFGAALVASVILNELVIFILVNILLSQRIEMFEQGMLMKTILTSLFGVLVYQLLTLFLREEPIEATRRQMNNSY
jgi:rod shape-determining protein MreD